MFTERSSTGDSSKTRSFFRSLLPSRKPAEPRFQVDGARFVPEEIKSKKILIVDDDAIIRKTLSTKLNGIGYQVVTAVDAADAIGAVREERPDLVVMDVFYPPDVSHGGGVPWDGFLLMNWLRATEHGQRVPVIFITGTLTPGFREKALAVGALALFEKPIDHPRLFASIEKALTSKTASDPNRQS
jgi:CheY-like chemotaxis protein